SLSIALATYLLRVINFASDYFGKPFWIQATSYILAYTLPFFIIATFFKRLTKIIAGITALVLILCFTCGFYLVGVKEMLSHYLLWTIAILICIATLIVIIYKDNKTKTA